MSPSIHALIELYTYALKWSDVVSLLLQITFFPSYILAKKRLKNEQKIAVFCFSSFIFCVNFRISKAFSTILPF